MIDTHKTVLALEKAGLSTEAAETITSVVTDAQSAADLVTKKDLDLAVARVELNITWRVATMLIAQVGILFALLKIFPL